MATLSEEQMTNNNLCKHCGEEATYRTKFHSGSYDYDEWYECSCETANKISELSYEITNLRNVLGNLERQRDYYLTQEHDTIRKSRIKTAVDFMLEENKFTLSELSQVIFPDNSKQENTDD